MKIIFVFSCSGMFRNVPACSGMFRVPGFIDARTKQCCSRAKQRQGKTKKRAARANLFFAN